MYPKFLGVCFVITRSKIKLFYNVFMLRSIEQNKSPVTQITDSHIPVGELGTGVPLALLEQNICIRIFLPWSFRPTLDNFVVDDSVLSNILVM